MPLRLIHGEGATDLVAIGPNGGKHRLIRFSSPRTMALAACLIAIGETGTYELTPHYRVHIERESESLTISRSNRHRHAKLYFGIAESRERLADMLEQGASTMAS